MIPREETANDEPVFALGTMVVTVFSGDTCSGSNSQFTVTNGGYRCVAVSNARSLSVSGSNCYVTTWSGTDCRGSSYNVQYQGCHGVLFGSVEVRCL
ncbi:uncharacterized protein EI97DRAFT_387854 [Westerdykella ornata]|uniref:Uncharacterized protein n=1 Tax=Westerdykella ornata TaxID=318751 RepID=A0A6A6J5P9_WESOR|nr:uncharacterized protein EI97DRAFT_387854 [Westerdykella ornata]KAF2271453.1 hypothetical protein EI97DRAFT_387854 [Westerdykella ornata]